MMSEETTWKPRTLSQAGSPVNLFRLRVNGKLKVMRDGSGQNLPVWSMSYDPDMCLWKTSPDFILQAVAKSSLILPRSGMMRNGTLYLLQRLVPHTSGKEFSFWRTPDVGAGGTSGLLKKGIRFRKNGQPITVRLVDQVNNPDFWPPEIGMWPTPSAHPAGEGPLLDKVTDKEGNAPKRNERVYNPDTGKHVQVTLNRAVKLWRTPSAQIIEPKSSVKKLSGRTPKDPQVGLAGQVGGSLNPTWVEWLMGFPLGWTDLEDSETP